MGEQSSIFIGSASETLEYANALQSVLDHDLVTTVWTYGVFTPSSSTLANLITRAGNTDFGGS